MNDVRMAVRVVPGSSRPGVGGRRGDALVVRVGERAVDGQATEAALRAIADAFGVPRRDVGLVRGATSRDKVVDVAGDGGVLAERLVAGLGGVPSSAPRVHAEQWGRCVTTSIPPSSDSHWACSAFSGSVSTSGGPRT